MLVSFRAVVCAQDVVAGRSVPATNAATV